MIRKRIRTIINQKLKEGYFKDANNATMLSYWIKLCPNAKYLNKVLNQSKELYSKPKNYVDGKQ
jgi:hypothetical protein